MTTPTTSPTVPAVTTPPKNGAHPAQPQQPVTPPVAAAEPSSAAELKQWQERTAKAEAAAAQKTREEIVNRRKWENEKKSFGDKLKAADEHAQMLKYANVNPEAVAKRLWGEKWYERLTAININGGAPTADSIAFELEQRDQAIEKKFEERDARRQEEYRQAEQRQLDGRVRAFRSDTLDSVKAKGGEYPLTQQHFRSPEGHADALFNYIVNEHARTTVKDPETGDLIKWGRAMTFDEAASALEAELYGIAERAAAHAKYAPKLREKLTPVKTPGSLPSVVKSSQASSQGNQSSQPRRTLGNDMTGSTPGEASKHRTEEQRMAAAMAQYEANRAKS